MTREVFRWVAFSAAVSTLIPLICLFIYRKRQPRHHLILAVSLCISFVFDAIGWTLMYQQKTTILSNNLYYIIAFPAIMLFYHETLVKRSLKIIVRIFTASFLVLATVSALDQGLNVMNYNTLTLGSILLTVTSFFFVGDLNLMDESKFASNPFHETNIIINTSLALYYFVTIVWFGLSDYVFAHFTYEDVRTFWTFHNAVQVLKNGGIAIAFYLCAKRSVEAVKFKKPHIRY
jgi:hypothetical protein